jgi:purine nucleosidase
MPGEFNIWNDPEAAAAVINSGAPVRWVGLDVTTQVRLTTADAQQMLDGDGSFSRFAGEATLAWIRHQAGENPGDPTAAGSCAMHDPLAVAVVGHPDLVTWTRAHVSVVTGEGNARGVMVTDTLASSRAPEPNCRIASGVDVDRFRKYFLAQINSL